MWPHRKADKLLEEMIRENKLAADATGDLPQHQPGPPGRRHETERLAAERAAKRRDRRSDLTIAALGVTLGLICALFPWYIFFNPEEFGVRAMKFGGSGGGTEPIMLGAQPDRVGAPVAVQELPPMELDLRTTGTAEKEPEDGGGGNPSLDLTDQPFPPPVVSFKVVQIANGRAMLEDSTGLFIVEAGSVLPDSTRVKSIEQRDGRPVLVTESGVELEISE